MKNKEFTHKNTKLGKEIYQKDKTIEELQSKVKSAEKCH